MFFFGKMEKKLDDARTVAMQLIFQVHDVTATLLPKPRGVDELFRQALSLQHVRKDTGDQHLLAIGSVEDSDPTPLG